MAQHGMLRDYRFTDAAEDIRGAKLYGVNDEKLGKIQDVIFDHSSGQIRYLVVDTGGWLSTKEFVVPADRLRASAEHQDDFAVDLTKQQIESFPPYKEADLESDEQWSDYENKYRSKWEASPVMHRAETDRNLTPTTQQMPGNSPSARAADALSAKLGTANLRTSNAGAQRLSPDDLADEETDTEALTDGGYAASTGSVEILSTANGIGPRWDRFQDRLRERRKEVINTGGTNESADTYRKAS
jgi:sporulation protein YlmC with PRC-barrel domain